MGQVAEKRKAARFVDERPFCEVAGPNGICLAAVYELIAELKTALTSNTLTVRRELICSKAWLKVVSFIRLIVQTSLGVWLPQTASHPLLSYYMGIVQKRQGLLLLT